MSQILLSSPREFFVTQVDEAVKRVKFEPSPFSRQYLVDLLEHYMLSQNLFCTRDTVAEMYLRAQNSPAPVRLELLKQLGDSTLYISGFFGDSLNRKIVDIEYYVDMGGMAYHSLAASATDKNASRMFGEFSARFAEFVDVLTFISQEARIQTNEDLLRLYDRYMATGSRLAGEQLVEKGLPIVELQKSKANKM